MSLIKGGLSTGFKQHWKMPDIGFAGWLLLWLTFNIVTLTTFPRVHSDEAWLAGLSHAVGVNRSLMVTEPFFDLFPRQPHAFKMLFHALQAVSIRLLGNSVQTVRLLALAGATVTLILMYRSWRRLSRGGWLAVVLVVAFSCQPVFLNAAHLARQESLLLAVLAGVGLLLDRLSADTTHRQAIRLFWLSVCIGLSALIHPNALMIAAMIGLPLLVDGLTGRLAWRQLVRPAGVLISIGLALVGLSMAVSPDFLSHYADFGANLAVNAAPAQRWQHIQQFFGQLWRQDTGTYDMPDLRGFLSAFAFLPVLSAGLLTLADSALTESERRGLEQGLAAGLGFLLSLFVIGRFNPTSIVFALWPVFQLLAWQLAFVSRHIQFKGFRSVLALVLLLAHLVSVRGDLALKVEPLLRPSATDSYTQYTLELLSNLPADAIVLGNLSAGFGLTGAGVPFYDIRNLAYAEDPTDYLRQNEITVVIWYEEYDYILRNPDWWVLYEIRPGRTSDPTALARLKAILDGQGVLIHTFSSPDYGTRVTAFQGDYPWQVSLIGIDPADLS